ncbi:RHS repeat-associated core domain-containing protein [Pantoea sp. A4]|uniref:RHS repeat-associated core domain-containing protein n=1 Tax=Pantoea sp. A4 TaxID=1225184 RepID=UPI00036344EF|nr:RHS repeat-associated core domain-containing protein [Pantoea sp. A4]
MSSNAPLAARAGDVLEHPSVLADFVSGITEGALYAAAFIGGTALAASGVGTAIGVALVVSAAVDGFPERWGNAAGEAVADLLGLTPTPDGLIVSGSPDVMIGGKPAARAAGTVDPAWINQPAVADSGSALQQALAIAATISAVVMNPQPLLAAMGKGLSDIDSAALLESLLSEMVQPLVASAAPHSTPAGQDQILCSKLHLAPGPLWLAEGSSKVFINGQPAARHGDRSTCEAMIKVLEDHRVRIGGDPVVVRDIRSGKNTLAWFIGSLSGGKALQRATALAQHLYRRVRTARMLKNIPCPLYASGHAAGTAARFGQLPARAMQTAHPVNLATGAKLLATEEELDFILDDRIPLRWQRIYHSLNPAEGMLGRGWMLPWETRLLGERNANGTLYLRWRDQSGRECGLGAVEPGDVVQFPVDGLTLFCSINGVLLLQNELGESQRYAADPLRVGEWRIVEIHDRHGNVQYLDWNSAGQLEFISGDNEAMKVRLRYHPESGRLATVHQVVVDDGSEHLLVAYHYDEAGQLLRVTDADLVVTRAFGWHHNGLLSSHRYAGGLRVSYDWQPGTNWRVCGYRVYDDTPQDEEIAWRAEAAACPLPPSVTDSANDATLTGPGALPGSSGLLESWYIVVDEQARWATVTQAGGATTRHEWDKHQRITRYVDPWQHAWHYTWAAHDELLLSTRMPDGACWQYGYDTQGRLEDITSPLGRTRSTRWHPLWALPVSEVDEAGGTWRCERNAKGDMISMTDARDATTTFTVNHYGDVKAETDAVGNLREYRYDSCGRLTRRTNCSGDSAWWRYDARGRLIAACDEAGNIHSWQWSTAGRLQVAETPSHIKTHYRYDGCGRYCGEETYLLVTALTHNARGQVTSHTSPAGRITRWRYDSNGELSAVVNPNEESWSLERDAAGRLSGQTDYAGIGQRLHYDACGRVTEVTDLPSSAAIEAGAEPPPDPWAWTQEPLAPRPVCPEPPPPQYAGWQDALPPAMTSLTLRFGYDADGRLTTRDSADHHTRYGYSGNAVSIQRVRQSGLPQHDEPEWEETQYFNYDAAGQWLEESGPHGAWRADRDVLGNMTQLQHPNGDREHFQRYGSGHLLTRLLEHDGGKLETAAFERDQLHREVSRSMGQLTQRTRYHMDGHTVRRDSPAIMRSSDWHPGDILSAEMVEIDGITQHRSYRYSADGDLLHYRAQEDERFAYDAAGNQSERADQRVWRNLLTRLGNVAQRFDGFGRVWQRTLPGGIRQRLFYNAEHQLSQVQFSGDRTFSHADYFYDALGRRSHKILHRHTPPGRETIPPETVTFVWQGMRLAEERSSLWPDTAVKYLYHEYSHEPLARIVCEGSRQDVEWYHCALNGRPEMLTDANGRVTWWGIPRGWGGMALEQDMGSRHRRPWLQQNLALQGQYVDHETGLHYNLHRYFCPLTGRFTQPDPIGLLGGINPYQYAPNALSWIDPLGLCKVNSGADVTPDIVRESLKGDTMQTLQASVSLPAIQRYVDRLLKGDVAPPIKVDGNIVVEGNHRYVAGKVAGKMPETVPGNLSPSQAQHIKPMSETTVDEFDWGNY